MYLQALAKINKLVMSIHVLLTMADSLKKKKKKKREGQLKTVIWKYFMKNNTT